MALHTVMIIFGVCFVTAAFSRSTRLHPAFSFEKVRAIRSAFTGRIALGFIGVVLLVSVINGLLRQ